MIKIDDVRLQAPRLERRRDRVHINILLASIYDRAARRRRERYCGAEEQSQAVHRCRFLQSALSVSECNFVSAATRRAKSAELQHVSCGSNAL